MQVAGNAGILSVEIKSTVSGPAFFETLPVQLRDTACASIHAAQRDFLTVRRERASRNFERSQQAWKGWSVCALAVIKLLDKDGCCMGRQLADQLCRVSAIRFAHHP